jgi:hypothetical protein
MNKIIFDTQMPPDFGGVFDGDSFGEMEFRAWVNTATTYPKIKLRSINKNGSHCAHQKDEKKQRD